MNLIRPVLNKVIKYYNRKEEVPYQFYHAPKSKKFCTAALVMSFSRDDLFEHFCRNNSLYLEVGRSKLHPNDNFCKETGREVAKSKAEVLKFKITKSEYVEERIHWTLECEEQDLRITVRTSDKAMKPHLLKVE